MKDNPTFTGTVTVPKPLITSSDNTAATTQFVNGVCDTKISALVNGAPGTLDTLRELATALNDDMNFGSTVVAALDNRYTKDALDTLLLLKANLASPTFTGIVSTSGQHYVMWLINSGQAPVETNIATVVPFGYLYASRGSSTLWDSGTQRFIIPTTGVWKIDFSCCFTSTSVATRLITTIKVNGVTRADNQGNKQSNAGGLAMSVNLLLTANDYVELLITHNASTVTNLPTTGGTAMSYRDRTSSPSTYAIFTFTG